MPNGSGSKTAIIFVGHHNIYHHLPAASFHDEIFCKRDPVLNIDSAQWGGGWGLGVWGAEINQADVFLLPCLCSFKKSPPGDVLVGL